MTDGWIKKLWYIYAMEYYSAIKRNVFESVLMRQMNLEITSCLQSPSAVILEPRKIKSVTISVFCSIYSP